MDNFKVRKKIERAILQSKRSAPAFQTLTRDLVLFVTSNVIGSGNTKQVLHKRKPFCDAFDYGFQLCLHIRTIDRYDGYKDSDKHPKNYDIIPISFTIFLGEQIYTRVFTQHQFLLCTKKIPQPITLFRLTFHTIYPRITSYYLETLRANRVITIKRYCRFVATSFELQFDKATFTLFIDKCESSSFGCTRYFLKLCIRIQMCSGKKKRLFVLR